MDRLLIDFFPVQLANIIEQYAISTLEEKMFTFLCNGKGNTFKVGMHYTFVIRQASICRDTFFTDKLLMCMYRGTFENEKQHSFKELYENKELSWLIPNYVIQNWKKQIDQLP